MEQVTEEPTRAVDLPQNPHNGSTAHVPTNILDPGKRVDLSPHNKSILGLYLNDLALRNASLNLSFGILVISQALRFWLKTRDA